MTQRRGLRPEGPHAKKTETEGPVVPTVSTKKATTFSMREANCQATGDGSWVLKRPIQHAHTHTNEELSLSAHPTTRTSHTRARVHAGQPNNKGARNPGVHARA